MRGSGRYFFVPSIAVRPSFWAVFGSTGRGSFGLCSPRCSFGKFSGLLGTLEFLSLRRPLSAHRVSRRERRVSRELQAARPAVSRASTPKLAYPFGTRTQGAKQRSSRLSTQFTARPARTSQSPSEGEWA